jgi:hypothetical protein
LLFQVPIMFDSLIYEVFCEPVSRFEVDDVSSAGFHSVVDNF